MAVLRRGATRGFNYIANTVISITFLTSHAPLIAYTLMDESATVLQLVWKQKRYESACGLLPLNGDAEFFS